MNENWFKKYNPYYQILQEIIEMWVLKQKLNEYIFFPNFNPHLGVKSEGTFEADLYLVRYIEMRYLEIIACQLLETSAPGTLK